MIFLRNLLRTKVRTALTLLGVTVGSGVFVCVASLTLDMQQQFAHSQAAYNTEVMISSADAGTPLRSRITSQEIEQLQAALQRPVSPMLTGQVSFDAAARRPLLGIDEQSLGMIPVVGGRPLQPGQPEVLIGVLLAESARVRVGATVRLGETEARVAGLFRSGSRYVDGGVIAGLPLAHRVLGRAGTPQDFNLALVQSGDETESARIVALVARQFPRLRAQPTVEFAGILQIMRTMEVSSWTVAFIALLGATIVVANTLVMVAAERTRELGVLMAIGWSPWLVLRMLLAEVAALCLAGTVLGNAAAQGLLSLLSQVHPAGQGWNLPTTIAPQAMLASAAAALLMAILVMAWPAHVVFRLQPAQAMRHD